MSVPLKRKITWACLAGDIALLIVLVAAGGLSGRDWGAGYAGAAFALIGIAASSFYLLFSRGRHS